ncbi:Sodium/myo-inositol cotransporter 2 [Armadillidium vulgare]|nr:Sodium/myo-inositol cotransporter 2 [Armadillidium vulgare]
MHWILVGSSLYGSNIGSIHFIGLAGSGASSGIGVAVMSNVSYFITWLVVCTRLHEFRNLHNARISEGEIWWPKNKDLLTCTLGLFFLQLVMNKTSSEWLYISILILLGFAAVFTIAGGLTAVIWTDFVQIILMLIGAFFLMVYAFAEVGGYHKMVEDYPYAIPSKRAGNSSCGIPPQDYMSLLRSPYPSESDLPWTGMTIGLTIIGTYYFSTDQVMVQRVLASKNMIHAKAGCVLASYLKLLPLWLMVFPGMIARILFPDTIGCSDPDECKKICGNARGCSNIAYPELVIKLLPTGLKGLMVAVMMASLMSSLTSVFNSASTIFTIDIWSRFRKRASDIELVIVGRIFVLILVAISIILDTGIAKLWQHTPLRLH